MFPPLYWFDEIRNGNYSVLSRVIRYGDPLYIFHETISNRISRGDHYFTGGLTIRDLRGTIIWKAMEMFRALSLHVVIFSTENEIRKTAYFIFFVCLVSH